jgi:hypothetical protein
MEKQRDKAARRAQRKLAGPQPQEDELLEPLDGPLPQTEASEPGGSE